MTRLYMSEREREIYIYRVNSSHRGIPSEDEMVYYDVHERLETIEEVPEEPFEEDFFGGCGMDDND